MSKKILRLLIIDDTPDDADLLAKQLRLARFMLKTRRVTDATGIQQAFEKNRWDAVVTDFRLQSINARITVDQISKLNADVPVIVYTNAITDDELLNIMRAGARDVVLKNNPARIIPAIERELAIAQERKEYRRASRAMKEMEKKHQAMVENSREAVCYCHDGMHTEVNQAYLSLFGYDNMEELEIVPVMNLISKQDQSRLKDALRKLGKGKAIEPLELTGIKKDGSEHSIEIALVQVTVNSEPCIQFTVSDISKRKMAENRLQYLTQRDPLTGLYNRHHFGKLLSEAITHKEHHALVYVDIYELKTIVNKLGYTTGDRILLKLSKLLRDTLGDDALLARLGGEEFALLLNGDEPAAMRIAVQIKKTLENNPVTEKEQTHRLRCAASVTMIDENSGGVQDILTRAVGACEQDKPKAKVTPIAPTGRVLDTGSNEAAELTLEPVPADETPDAPAPEVKPATSAVPEGFPADPEPQPLSIDDEPPTWEKRIQAALDNDHFHLVYQPIISLHGESEEFFEVLLRLTGENGEQITPGTFIPEAEKTGQMHAIDRWVIKRAVETLTIQHAEGRQTTFFINVAASAFSDDTLPPLIKSFISATGMEPASLVFEFNESDIKANDEEASQLIADIADLGCPISIDNFSGDLGCLLGLPRHTIKYVKLRGNLAQYNNEEQGALKESLNATRKLDIKIVAKEVEDASNLSTIWSFGFDYVQGNYFQAADNTLDYQFAEDDETTLSSDTASSSWSA